MSTVQHLEPFLLPLNYSCLVIHERLGTHSIKNPDLDVWANVLPF